jgi:urea-proton symporter
MNATNALALTGVYIAAMFLVAMTTRRKHQTAGDFLLMNRQLGVFKGAFSIAASWIWAPAVFICSQKSYQQGLPGIFWFTAPNILCFFVFVPIALRARTLLPHGYSMPDFLRVRFSDHSGVHLSSLVVYFGYQLGAIVINSLAGGILVNTLTGLPIALCIVLMSAAALTYSLIGGLRASVMTDVVQMCLILFVAFIIVPWVLVKVGGPSILVHGLGGKSGEFTNIFDPSVAYSFGIASTIGLISGPLADQMWFQRAFAAKREAIKQIYVIGGLAFGIVPIVLSILGFIAAAPEIQAQLSVTDPQMVGPEVVEKFLPSWALAAFVVLAFAGLSSVLDSAFAAVSSMTAVDVFKRYVRPNASEPAMVLIARVGMLVFAAVGTSIALLRPQLVWVFLVYGALASAMLVPVFFSLFSNRVTARGVIVAILGSVVASVPLSIYANVNQSADLIVLAAVIPPVIGLVSCCVSVVLNKERFDYTKFSERLAHEGWRHDEQGRRIDDA